ncbi:uncharacterized protein LOC143597297 [Bidens hawaiensis]|uniref:uncharacterized protein LOC143597297 n=1 Tax=Bidens hawaiensis TaxID=980011 RepID=UPI004049B372
MPFDHCHLVQKLVTSRVIGIVEGPETEHACKVELKPWNFWRKHGSKSFVVDGTRLTYFGTKSPQMVSGDEVVLVLGDMKKDAYRKTGCRPALTDAVLVSNMFLGGFHDVLIECINRSNADLEMEIRIDGDLMVHVKHLQWKFRGNELIKFKKGFIEVYWDVHDWLFSPGLRHALFIIKPSALPPPVPPVLTSPASVCGSVQGLDSVCLYEFCLFLYAWKVE